jgi:uncharacterized SAM-binding protein YcdF (DUF218 family)
VETIQLRGVWGNQTLNKYSKREHIISYIAPYLALFPTEYALAFGTRHGVPVFADDILSLYSSGYFKNLIISGGITPPGEPSEARIMLRELAARGIPESSIVLEEMATNTSENVIFSRARVQALELRELLLIGKISSKRRYIMTVKKRWPEITTICCHGVNYFGCDEPQWWKDKEFRRRVLSECRKIRSYLEKGFISEVSIVNGVVM